jgi:hypothetical protein
MEELSTFLENNIPWTEEGRLERDRVLAQVEPCLAKPHNFALCLINLADEALEKIERLSSQKTQQNGELNFLKDLLQVLDRPAFYENEKKRKRHESEKASEQFNRN